MTDPVADLLTRIRNAVKARERKVDMAPSNLRVAILDILVKNGFIKNYKLFRQGQKGIVRVYLKYVGKNQPVLRGLQRVSRPSRRVYTRYDRIPKPMGGLGMYILSTSKGLMTDGGARESKVGGEVVCAVW